MTTDSGCLRLAAIIKAWPTLSETVRQQEVGLVQVAARRRSSARWNWDQEAPFQADLTGRRPAFIGKKAGVVVNKADGKSASAHDLRRAFGTRWAKRVMPAVLRRLMRHSSIQTTMACYVDLDSAEVADELWANFGTTIDATPRDGKKVVAGNTLGNTEPEDATFDAGGKSTSDYPLRD